MKRFFLSSIYTLALFILAGNIQATAQQETPAPDKIIVIQKQKNDDGTVKVKKKRFEKGEALETYVKELELEKNPETDVEVIVIGDGTDEEKAAGGETLIYIREAGKHEIEVKGSGDFEKEFQKMKFKFKNEPHFDDHHNFHQEHFYESGNVKMVETKKTFLGVYPSSGDQGVNLTGIVEGSGAAAAGLQEGDIMTSINGNNILTTSDLHNELAKYKANDVVTVAYLRNGQLSKTEVTLSEKTTTSYVRERNPCKVFIGVYVGSYGNGDEGVMVNGIVEGSDWPAQKAGLREGDRIVAMDGMPVYDHSSLVSERNKHKPGDFFTITYLRDGKLQDVEAQFKECPNDETTQEEIIEEVPPVNQPIELLDNSLQLEELAAYPNPTYGNLNVRFSGKAVPTTLTITDVTGKVVHSENLSNFDGYYNKQLDVSAGAPGNLIVSIRQQGKVVSTPVILLNRA